MTETILWILLIFIIVAGIFIYLSTSGNICKWLDHDYLSTYRFEHVCTRAVCMRCGNQETLHLTGPWPHTCGEVDDAGG